MKKRFRRGFIYYFSNRKYKRYKFWHRHTSEIEAYSSVLDGSRVKKIKDKDVYFIICDGKYFSVLPQWCRKGGLCERVFNK